MGKSTFRNIVEIIQKNTKLRHRCYHEIILE